MALNSLKLATYQKSRTKDEFYRRKFTAPNLHLQIWSGKGAAEILKKNWGENYSVKREGQIDKSIPTRSEPLRPLGQIHRRRET